MILNGGGGGIALLVVRCQFVDRNFKHSKNSDQKLYYFKSIFQPTTGEDGERIARSSRKFDGNKTAHNVNCYLIPSNMFYFVTFEHSTSP